MNYKAVCHDLLQRLELVQKALADKRSVEDRNRKFEASQKSMSSELKVLKLKDGLDVMEKYNGPQKLDSVLSSV